METTFRIRKFTALNVKRTEEYLSEKAAEGLFLESIFAEHIFIFKKGKPKSLIYSIVPMYLVEKYDYGTSPGVKDKYGWEHVYTQVTRAMSTGIFQASASDEVEYPFIEEERYFVYEAYMGKMARSYGMSFGILAIMFFEFFSMRILEVFIYGSLSSKIIILSLALIVLDSIIYVLDIIRLIYANRDREGDIIYLNKNYSLAGLLVPLAFLLLFGGFLLNI